MKQLKYITLGAVIFVTLSLNAEVSQFFKGFWTFIKEAKNGHLIEIGTIFPCSKATGKKLIAHIDQEDLPAQDQKLYILEVGGGTGTMTVAFIEKLEEMHKKMGRSYQLDVVEILPNCCAIFAGPV